MIRRSRSSVNSRHDRRIIDDNRDGSTLLHNSIAGERLNIHYDPYNAGRWLSDSDTIHEPRSYRQRFVAECIAPARNVKHDARWVNKLERDLINIYVAVLTSLPALIIVSHFILP